MPEFKYIDVVRLAINAANARVPRLQPSAIAEFGDMVSSEVTRGVWTQVGDKMLNADHEGMDHEQYLEHLISTRPHWIVPAVLQDAEDDTWTSGSLAKQGQRWKDLRAFLGNDKAADATLAEEAARFGTKPGSTVPGVRPGEEPPKKDTSNLPPSSNPYSDACRLSADERIARINSMIRAMGTKAVNGIAAAAGKKIDGSPLKRR
jgi:hypothetical protein